MTYKTESVARAGRCAPEFVRSIRTGGLRTKALQNGLIEWANLIA